MGYPDVIAPMEMLSHFLGEKVKDIKYREDSLQICARHGLRPREIPDAESLFSLFGCALDVYDIVQERGNEILCDLNQPMQAFGTYDIVLDVGTVEHCFNVAQAVKNMAGLLREGGIIIHENPFLAGNHGFYGLNPTWYVDFYETNGFKVLKCHLAKKDGTGWNVPLTKRFKFTEESNVFAMAQRMETKPMTYPIQSKYRSLNAH